MALLLHSTLNYLGLTIPAYAPLWQVTAALAAHAVKLLAFSTTLVQCVAKSLAPHVSVLTQPIEKMVT